MYLLGAEARFGRTRLWVETTAKTSTPSIYQWSARIPICARKFGFCRCTLHDHTQPGGALAADTPRANCGAVIFREDPSRCKAFGQVSRLGNRTSAQYAMRSQRPHRRQRWRDKGGCARHQPLDRPITRASCVTSSADVARLGSGSAHRASKARAMVMRLLSPSDKSAVPDSPTDRV